MNLRDLFIIYLACGAPFGVYYFLQNRNHLETKILWLKSLLRFVCWIPFAVQMVARKSLFTNLYNNGFDKIAHSEAIKESEIEEIKKFFEKRLSARRFGLSVFEFRETFDRYAGLSLEIQSEAAETAATETEIFRIANHTNKALAEICLHRRNRKRLLFHQKLARRDFFEVFDKFFDQADDPENLLSKAAQLADMINDFEAKKMLENMSKDLLQTRKKQPVNELGEEIWNSEKHKPHTDNKISTNLQAMTAATTANLRSSKD